MKNNNRKTEKFSKEEIENLGKLRIIQKNLIHLHGFPRNLARTEKLKSMEYLGQYGKIIKGMITYKINPENNKKVYSAYITYSNEREASFAILCVDSLLIEGKIIRAFFGTTKYCLYFLNNNICPNLDKCLYLHHLIDDKDIILDNNTLFSYNEHLNLAKKIIQFSNPLTKELILKMKKSKKYKFPFLDFIFLKEEEKEKYFTSGNISYVSYNNNCNYDKDNNIVSNNFIEKKTEINNHMNFNNIKFYFVNNSVFNFDLNKIDNIPKSNAIKHSIFINVNPNSSNDQKSMEWDDLLNTSIKHILYSKPFFSTIKNFNLRKSEFDYVKKELAKEGKEINEVFEGCLDKISDLL